MKFFPNFFLRELMAWYIALGVLGALAAILPWELGTKADPFAPAPAGIRPEWYFMFMFQTLKKIPAKLWFVDGDVLGILVFGVAGIHLAAVAVLRSIRRQARTETRSRRRDIRSQLYHRDDNLWIHG